MSLIRFCTVCHWGTSSQLNWPKILNVHNSSRNICVMISICGTGFMIVFFFFTLSKLKEMLQHDILKENKIWEFHADRLLRRQFAWNIKPYSLGYLIWFLVIWPSQHLRSCWADLGFRALSRIFHLYRADRSSKVGENQRTRRKTIHKQNLAFPHMPRARLEPQRWET